MVRPFGSFWRIEASPSAGTDQTSTAIFAPAFLVRIIAGYLSSMDQSRYIGWVTVSQTNVPRATTTSDAFNAIAEPRRREILSYLAPREHPVGDIVFNLRLAQPSVSKHLRVLRDVGLVRVRRQGRRMLYRTNAEAIRPLHDWAKTFEHFWQHQLLRIKERAEARAQQSIQQDPDKEER